MKYGILLVLCLSLSGRGSFGKNFIKMAATVTQKGKPKICSEMSGVRKADCVNQTNAIKEAIAKQR